MTRQFPSCPDNVLKSSLLRGWLALLIMSALLVANATSPVRAEEPVASPALRVTHVLGFEDVPRNASGELSINDTDVSFRRGSNPAAHVSIKSIHNTSIGEQSKQVGGVPMMMGKAAVPFGGGRVVSLFSHRKYDSLTLEYFDSNGGFHGAIFRLAKGQGETFKNALVAHGAHLTDPEDPLFATSTTEPSVGNQKWSVQVGRVDPAATGLDPCFSDAIYENLLRELPKSGQFQAIFRSGDRNASKVSELLVLKTVVEKYSPGSETQRAVTTITGATKLKVHIQLLTRDGHVLSEHIVNGDVRFMGENLGATNKLARNTAKILKRSKLPAPAMLIPAGHTPPMEATVGI